MFVLLASPLVGPSTWSTAAEALRRRGREATVVDLRSIVTPSGPDLEAAADLVRAASGAGSVLVPHSGAGPLTPTLLERLDGVGAVFVDAGVPPAGVDRVPLAPPAFLEHLRPLADRSGMLPPWASWFGDDAIAEIVPARETRERLVGEMPRIPLSYLTSTVPVPAGWPSRTCAFLAFGAEAYAEDIARARAFGWPVRVLERAGHLHPAVEPGIVADALLAYDVA